MSLWADFISTIGSIIYSDDSERKIDRRAKSDECEKSRSGSCGSNIIEPGSIHCGNVCYVAANFAKIEGNGIRAVVHRHEISNGFVRDVSEELGIDENVEFVLLHLNPKNKEEWVVSLSAVEDARNREALSWFDIGDELDGTAVHLTDRRAEFDCDGIPARAPVGELSWGRVRSPSDVIRLHERYRGQIMRIHAPEDWLTNKKSRCAHAIISIRACTSRPKSPLVPMPFSAQPFRLWVEPRKPRDCDPVVLYVLEEIGKGYSLQDLGGTTGLPTQTLKAIVSLLETKGLATSAGLTARGQQLAESIWTARARNEEPIRGLYASAAPAHEQFQPINESQTVPEYPRPWPRPAYNRQAEDLFTRATDEALPELLIAQVAGNEKQAMLQELQAHPGLRVFLRRDGKLPWRTLWIDVPEHWILAGLWSAFEPVGEPPFCPEEVPDRCRSLLLVRAKVDIADGGTGTPQTIYFEPWTKTCWTLKRPGQVREATRDETAFPQLPEPARLGISTPEGQVAYITPERWVAAEIKA